jgi:hypothetical protein
MRSSVEVWTTDADAVMLGVTESSEAVIDAEPTRVEAVIVAP